jgi:hypothetical protein
VFKKSMSPVLIKYWDVEDLPNSIHRVTWHPMVRVLESEKCGKGHPLPHKGSLHDVSAATNMHTAVEELLAEVFSDQSDTKSWDRK